MSEHEVEFITMSSGIRLLASDLACSQCNALDLGTTVERVTEFPNVLIASCSRQHAWAVRLLGCEDAEFEAFVALYGAS